MMERRTKRSSERDEALQYLVETVADRSGVRALVLIDDGGHVIAGMGMPIDVAGLAVTARDVAWRRATPASIDAATAGRDGCDGRDGRDEYDVTARTVATRDGLLYFGALGGGMAGVGSAVCAVQRILMETAA
jgi:hypothetical protein